MLSEGGHVPAPGAATSSIYCCFFHKYVINYLFNYTIIMANRSIDERNVRSLMRNKGGTYLLSLPIEFVKKLKWREKQKLTITMKGKSIVVSDWKK
jgi:hypothetical protein